MKSEAYAAHDEPAKTQSISEQLEAPISLNPEQLEAAVGGLTLSPGRRIVQNKPSGSLPGSMLLTWWSESN